MGLDEMCVEVFGNGSAHQGERLNCQSGLTRSMPSWDVSKTHWRHQRLETGDVCSWFLPNDAHAAKFFSHRSRRVSTAVAMQQGISYPGGFVPRDMQPHTASG
jgi:hypothetical protein